MMPHFKISLFIVCVIILSAVTDVVQSKYTYKPEIQRFVSQKKIIANWATAARKCEIQGAILASPIDAEVLKVMRSYIDVQYHFTAYFIGVKAKHNNDVSDVNFVSVEGVDLDDMPDATLEMIDKIDPLEGDCLSMDAQNIRVVSCEARLPYICYTDIGSDVTPTTTTTEKPTTGRGPNQTRTTPSTSSGQISITEFAVPRLIEMGKDAELRCQYALGPDEEESSLVVTWWRITDTSVIPNHNVLIYQKVAGYSPKVFQNSFPAKIEVKQNDTIVLKNVNAMSSGSYECQVSTFTSEDRMRGSLTVSNTKSRQN